MRIGKLGEGVYKLTVGPSGRTISRAKMVKAIKKPQEMRDEKREVAEPIPAEVVAEFPLKDWWTAAELAIELGISRQKVYENRSALAKYISRPDGKRYLYHRDLLEDKQAVATLKGIPQLPATRKAHEETQNIEPATPVAEAGMATASAEAQEVETEEIVPIKVERQVYCKELDRTFPSVTDGAKAIGARRESLSKALRAGQRCRGYTFTYVDEKNMVSNVLPGPTVEHVLPAQMAEKEWYTTKEVADMFGLPRKTVCVVLSRLETALHKKYKGTNLVHRNALLNQVWVETLEHSKRVAPKPVHCKETGATYKTIGDAARSIGVDRSQLSNALSSGHCCGGYTFEYA